RARLARPCASPARESPTPFARSPVAADQQGSTPGDFTPKIGTSLEPRWRREWGLKTIFLRTDGGACGTFPACLRGFRGAPSSSLLRPGSAAPLRLAGEAIRNARYRDWSSG